MITASIWIKVKYLQEDLDIPPVQFLSCSPTLLKDTAALACRVFCRQHLHGYTTPGIPHGQAIHVSSVGSLSHLKKFGTVSKHLPLKKFFKDIHSKDLFMSGKTRSTEHTMQIETLASNPRTKVVPSTEMGALLSAHFPAKPGLALW